MALSRQTMAAVQQPVGKISESTSVAELVDVILDKGIVIDGWARVSVLGLELLTIEARMTVTSAETYLRYADAIARTTLAAPPPWQRAVSGGKASTTGSWRARCYALSPSTRKRFRLHPLDARVTWAGAWNDSGRTASGRGDMAG